MCRKLVFLTFICSLLALLGPAQAATDINVVNPSFETDYYSNQITCHTGQWSGPGPLIDADMWGWSHGAEDGWIGVDVLCGAPGVCEWNCRDWLEFTNGIAHCYMETGTSLYQVLDHDIAAGYKYEIIFDGLAAADDVNVSFFYTEDANFPDVNHIEIDSEFIPLDIAYDGNGLALWMYDITVEGVVTDTSCIGRPLGIKFTAVYDDGWEWVWLDNIRVVEVPDPLLLMDVLMQQVADLGLHGGIENSLIVKLNAAMRKLTDGNEKNDIAAINSLMAFINEVEAQSGKKIPQLDADDLIAAALEIISLLSA
jgi:hypothetical protein